MFFPSSLFTSFLVFYLSSTRTSASPSSTALAESQAALTTLQTWYNTTSGLWNTCGWWNGANAMTVLADLASIDSSTLPTALYVFNNTYNVAPSVNPAPGVEKVNKNGMPITTYPPGWPFFHPKEGVNASQWLDGYYDDDSWWALAWIAAYDVSKNEEYLGLAIGIFEDLTQGWPTTCNNGGVWWDNTHTYINAIANELFMSVAAHLANRVWWNREYYINWAQREWEWFQSSGMINSKSTINDGLTSDDTCENNNQTVWTYNQGVVLGALVELNRASPNPAYLQSATKIALAAIASLTDSNSVLHEPGCEPNCAPDATQFKGIFIRNLQLLQAAAPNEEFVKVIQASANSIWANDRGPGGELSIDWAGPFVGMANASTHSSAMDALVASILVY